MNIDTTYHPTEVNTKELRNEIITNFNLLNHQNISPSFKTPSPRPQEPEKGHGNSR